MHRFIGKKLSRFLITACKTICAVLVLALLCDNTVVFAETEPTYELTEETENAKAFVVRITTTLNVRTGPGTSFKKIKHPVTGKSVSLKKNDLVAVMRECTATYEDGSVDLWYEVRWVNEGIEFHGYINAHYTRNTGDPAIPLPTPTPLVPYTPTPTPEPEVPTATPTPTNTPTPTPAKPGMGTQANSTPPWTAPLIIGSIILGISAIFGIYAFIKERIVVAEDGNSVKFVGKHKQAEMERLLAANAVPEISEAEKAERAEAEARAEAERQRIAEKEERERQEAMERIARENERVREMLDELKVNDRVGHRFFGAGVVTDNSDPKNIEIRFGDEVRVIDKENAAAKHILRKL